MGISLSDFRNRISKLSKSKHFSFGVPLLIFVVGGSFALEQFAKIRYEFRKVNPYLLPDQENFLISTVKPEEEYEKMKQMNTEKWENVRISRPWEDQKPK